LGTSTAFFSTTAQYHYSFFLTKSDVLAMRP
jgi:hypothetical protein